MKKSILLLILALTVSAGMLQAQPNMAIAINGVRGSSSATICNGLGMQFVLTCDSTITSVTWTNAENNSMQKNTKGDTMTVNSITAASGQTDFYAYVIGGKNNQYLRYAVITVYLRPLPQLTVSGAKQCGLTVGTQMNVNITSAVVYPITVNAYADAAKTVSIGTITINSGTTATLPILPMGATQSIYFKSTDANGCIAPN